MSDKHIVCQECHATVSGADVLHTFKDCTIFKLEAERDRLKDELAQTIDDACCQKIFSDREIDRLKAELEDYKFQTKHSVNIWKSKAEKLAEALRNIRNELGIPQPDYPAPVTNAANYAKEALAEFD